MKMSNRIIPLVMEYKHRGTPSPVWIDVALFESSFQHTRTVHVCGDIPRRFVVVRPVVEIASVFKQLDKNLLDRVNESPVEGGKACLVHERQIGSQADQNLHGERISLIGGPIVHSQMQAIKALVVKNGIVCPALRDQIIRNVYQAVSASPLERRRVEISSLMIHLGTFGHEVLESSQFVVDSTPMQSTNVVVQHVIHVHLVILQHVSQNAKIATLSSPHIRLDKLCLFFVLGQIDLVQGNQNPHGIGVSNTSGVALDTNDSLASGQKTKLDGMLDTELESVLDVLDPVLVAWIFIDKWIHASIQVAVSGRSWVSGDHDDRTVRSVLGNESGGGSGGGQDNHDLGALIKGR
ncbi:hypothetical protein OGATHE_002896 [Ogataea polymorpha]|uniref:Uncharacterized protein n=1 Tax=Ogataea polymorpha TaxID=460523 RepID=A0A9P8T8C1_9ASCO|nr:hypothetical protein OGATHE_002896 [Ogataea polymorpha]